MRQIFTHKGEKVKKLPTIVVLATGGTIAGQKDGKTYRAGAVKISEFLSVFEWLEGIAQVRTEQFCQIGSQDMTSKILLSLCRRVQELVEDESVDGVVVTHGTDTLEESAFLLNLCVASKKPVVLTGAMKSSDSLGSDGAANLFDAVCVAANKEAWGKGVLVVMSSLIHAAREVSKTHTTSLCAFASPNSGAIGSAFRRKVRFYLAPLRRHTTSSEFAPLRAAELPRVDVLYSGVDGVSKELLDASLRGTKAVVACGVGNGNFSQSVLEALKQAAQNGVAVVRVSRTLRGEISASGEVNDAECGFLRGDNLNAQKARILLQVALASGLKNEDLARVFEEY